LAINITCDIFQGPEDGKPEILKFANIERFFVVSPANQAIVKNTVVE
jgi:hypothetical protein